MYCTTLNQLLVARTIPNTLIGCAQLQKVVSSVKHESAQE